MCFLLQKTCATASPHLQNRTENPCIGSSIVPLATRFIERPPTREGCLLLCLRQRRGRYPSDSARPALADAGCHRNVYSRQRTGSPAQLSVSGETS